MSIPETWKDGKMVRQRYYIWAEGAKYAGEWKEGTLNGKAPSLARYRAKVDGILKTTDLSVNNSNTIFLD
jgi:hypothetical protein